MSVYKFEINGVTPILMNHDNIEGADELDTYRKSPENKKASKAGDDRSPAWSYQKCFYHDGKHVCLPSDNLMSCIRKAAAEITLKKQTSFKALSQSGMMIEQEFMEFRSGDKRIALADLPGRDATYQEHCKACEKLGFRLFAKRATVGQSKHIRVRPRFDTWSLRGSVLVKDETITKEVLTQMLTIAGKNVGLGDWRPGCRTPGPFGTFSVKLS